MPPSRSSPATASTLIRSGATRWWSVTKNSTYPLTGWGSTPSWGCARTHKARLKRSSSPIHVTSSSSSCGIQKSREGNRPTRRAVPPSSLFATRCSRTHYFCGIRVIRGSVSPRRAFDLLCQLLNLLRFVHHPQREDILVRLIEVFLKRLGKLRKLVGVTFHL